MQQRVIYPSVHISVSTGVQVKGERRAPPRSASPRPAAGQPSLPTGRAAARLHQCDAEEKQRHPVDGDGGESRSPASAPLPQRTWIVLVVQRAGVVHFYILSISFFIVKFTSL